MAKLLEVTELYLVTGSETIEDEDLELRVPDGEEIRAAVEELRFLVSKHNKVPPEQVEVMLQFRFPHSLVGRVFPV